MKLLTALLLGLALVCIGLVVCAQDRSQHLQPSATQFVNWCLAGGFVYDADTSEVRGSYTLSKVPGDRRAQDGFLIITIGTRNGAWIVLVVPGTPERPTRQVVSATGLLGITKWVPKDRQMEIGDVRWAMAVRGTLEEVTNGR